MLLFNVVIFYLFTARGKYSLTRRTLHFVYRVFLKVFIQQKLVQFQTVWRPNTPCTSFCQTKNQAGLTPAVALRVVMVVNYCSDVF